MSEYYKTREKITPQSTTKEPVGLRQTRRFPIRNATIKIRKTGMLKYILLHTGNDASLVNLSKSGLQLMISETLKAEDNYQINLYIPGFINPLIMKARVVWCRPYKKFYDKTYYRAGFQFIKLSQEVRGTLKKLEAAATKKAQKAKTLQAADRGMVQTTV